MNYKVGDRVWVQMSRDRERLGTVIDWRPASQTYVVRIDSAEPITVGVDDLRPAFETGGTKHDTGKNRVDLIPATAIEAMGEAFTFGANKYADHNWAKGFKYSRLIGAAMRHILAYSKGEDKDPESGLSHIAHAQACLAMLSAHEVEGLGTDDRRKV